MNTILAALLAATAASAGPAYPGTGRNLRVSVPRMEATVEIDGQPSEPVWEQAARLTAFSQYAPDDGRAANDETEVLVWYAPTAIYFGIRAHAAPGTARATLAARDRIDSDDCSGRSGTTGSSRISQRRGPFSSPATATRCRTRRIRSRARCGARATCSS